VLSVNACIAFKTVREPTAELFELQMTSLLTYWLRTKRRRAGGTGRVRKAVNKENVEVL